MRLTSTGLGIGTSSPAYKLDVSVGSGGGFIAAKFKSEYSASLLIGTDNTAAWIGQGTNALNTSIGIDNTNGYVFFRTNNTNRATLNASGNLGLGVTPSAWYSSEGYKALQVGNASLFGRNSTNSELYLSSNTFENSSGSPTYITSDFATRYLQNDGVHAWYNAPSGTAGNTFTFTQAMTLDASGNLALGTTTVQNLASGRGNITIGGTSSSILNFSYNNSDNGYIFHNGDLNIVNRTSTGPIIFGAGSGSV